MKAEVCHLNCFIIVWWLLPVRINFTYGKLRTDNLRFIHISLNFHWKWNVVFSFKHTRNTDDYRFLGGSHDCLERIIQRAASFVLKAGGYGEVCDFWKHLFVRIFIILINKIAQAQAQKFSLACLTLTLISSQKEYCDFSGHNMIWIFNIVWWHFMISHTVSSRKKPFKKFFVFVFL